jgi:hypothetical protein
MPEVCRISMANVDSGRARAEPLNVQVTPDGKTPLLAEAARSVAMWRLVALLKDRGKGSQGGG